MYNNENHTTTNPSTHTIFPLTLSIIIGSNIFQPSEHMYFIFIIIPLSELNPLLHLLKGFFQHSSKLGAHFFNLSPELFDLFVFFVNSLSGLQP